MLNLIIILLKKNIRPEGLGFGHAIYLNSHTYLRVIRKKYVDFLLSSKLKWEQPSLFFNAFDPSYILYSITDLSR